MFLTIMRSTAPTALSFALSRADGLEIGMPSKSGLGLARIGMYWGERSMCPSSRRCHQARCRRAEQRFCPLRDLRLQRTSEIGKAADGGGTVAEETVLFIQDGERLDLSQRLRWAHVVVSNQRKASGKHLREHRSEEGRDRSNKTLRG